MLMKPVDAAWLAGLLEGEGSFFVTRDQPRVNLQMTDKDVVEKAAQLWGTTVWCASARSEKHKNVWKAAATGKRAVELMTLIRPFMGERRGARIDELLERFA